jgi:hypothetical protein
VYDHHRRTNRHNSPGDKTPGSPGNSDASNEFDLLKAEPPSSNLTNEQIPPTDMILNVEVFYQPRR